MTCCRTGRCRGAASRRGGRRTCTCAGAWTPSRRCSRASVPTARCGCGRAGHQPAGLAGRVRLDAGRPDIVPRAVRVQAPGRAPRPAPGRALPGVHLRDGVRVEAVRRGRGGGAAWGVTLDERTTEPAEPDGGRHRSQLPPAGVAVGPGGALGSHVGGGCSDRLCHAAVPHRLGTGGGTRRRAAPDAAHAGGRSRAPRGARGRASPDRGATWDACPRTATCWPAPRSLASTTSSPRRDCCSGPDCCLRRARPGARVRTGDAAPADLRRAPSPVSARGTLPDASPPE